MHLTELTVERVRVVERAEIAFAKGINVLTGANGAGKTSVLESIHLLGTGRSFRATNARELVTRGASRLLCRCQVLTDRGRKVTLGIEQGEGAVRIRCDGADVKSASSLARMLPMVVVSPDSQRLLTDGAELRRGVVDWALFHVEPSYGALHSRFRRALKQRNAALKQGFFGQSLRAFDTEFTELGEQIHGLRQRHLVDGLPLIESFVQRLVRKAVSCRYTHGWEDGVTLEEALHVNEQRDRVRGFTSVGPHRADLKLTVEGVRAARVLSRGESKLCVIALYLSQVEFLSEVRGERCIVLLDELASELDESSRSVVFDCLEELRCQAFLTAVSPELVEGCATSVSRMFHVEQGEVSVVV